MKKISIALLIVFLIGGTVAYLMYNKPHQDIGKATTDFGVNAAVLFAEFSENEEAANAKYLNKIIEVSGTIKEAKTSENGEAAVVLDTEDPIFGVICQLDDPAIQSNTFNPGQHITLKGVCAGMLTDVVLTRCVPVN